MLTAGEVMNEGGVGGVEVRYEIIGVEGGLTGIGVKVVLGHGLGLTVFGVVVRGGDHIGKVFRVGVAGVTEGRMGTASGVKAVGVAVEGSAGAIVIGPPLVMVRTTVHTGVGPPTGSNHGFPHTVLFQIHLGMGRGKGGGGSGRGKTAGVDIDDAGIDPVGRHLRR